MRYINCLNNISAKGTDLLGSDYQLTDDIAQASGVLVRSAAMHDMDLPESLLAVARAGAGVNNIPLDKCAEAGVVVFNTPGANANAVKELVLCGMLLASRGILPGAAWCREHADSPTIGKDAEKAKKAFAGQEIFGKTLGVIGLGAIGALVANAAIDLGMNVLGYDPYVSAEAAWRLSPSVEHVTNLDDVLHRSDYVTIHVPAMDSTRGMIGAHELEVAKPGCAVMNFINLAIWWVCIWAEVNDEAATGRFRAGLAADCRTACDSVSGGSFEMTGCLPVVCALGEPAEVCHNDQLGKRKGRG